MISTRYHAHVRTIYKILKFQKVQDVYKLELVKIYGQTSRRFTAQCPQHSTPLCYQIHVASKE